MPPIRAASLVSPNQRRASVRSAGRARRVRSERHLLVLSAPQAPLAHPLAAASSAKHRSLQRARMHLEEEAFLGRSPPQGLVRPLHQVSVGHWAIWGCFVSYVDCLLASHRCTNASDYGNNQSPLCAVYRERGRKRRDPLSKYFMHASIPWIVV